MKLALLFLAVLGIAAGSHIDFQLQEKVDTCPANLEEEWAMYVAIIPRGQIINIVITYLASDVEVQNMVLYLVSDEFQAIVEELDCEPDFIALLDYLETICVGMYDFLNAIHEFLGLPMIGSLPCVPTTTLADLEEEAVVDATPQKRARFQKLGEILEHLKKSYKGKSGGDTKGWDEMWADLAAIWPKEEMQALHQSLLISSADYKLMFDNLGSQECHDHVQAVIVLPSWVAFMDDLRRGGIDVDKIRAWVQNLLGWTP